MPPTLSARVRRFLWGRAENSGRLRKALFRSGVLRSWNDAGLRADAVARRDEYDVGLVISAKVGLFEMTEASSSRRRRRVVQMSATRFVYRRAMCGAP